MATAAVYEQIGRRFVELAGEAEFAATPKNGVGTLKAKKCMTGLSCGGACISKSKICNRSLTPKQQQLVKQLKKDLAGGDTNVAKRLDAIKAGQSKKQAAAQNKAAKSGSDDLSLYDLDKSEAMLKDSLGKMSGKSGEALDLAWNKIKLDNNIDSDVSLEELDRQEGQGKAQTDGIKESRKNLATQKEAENKKKEADSKPKEPAPRQKAMWVDTKSIKSSRPRSDFDEKDIEDLADSILESGGLHRPILLKQSGAGAYEVVDGHLAYHAAARAREKDLEKGSEVNGIILDDDYAEGSLAQVRKLAKAESPLAIPDGKKFEKRDKFFEGNRAHKAMWVETKGIKSSRPKSDFDEKDIEDLADSMIANGGAMRPLILGKVGFQSYEVVDGHLTYHAAVRAKEKDIKRMEEVNGFVLEPENMANVAKQLKILDRSQLPKNNL